VIDRARHCARPGCGGAATASLSYRYVDRLAWLDDLAADTEPSTHDLCTAHADGLRVPVGWTLEDRRSGTRLPFLSTIAV